jgi:hypothetical protein
LKVYDETVQVLRRALESAKVGETVRVDGLRRLDRFVRGIEVGHVPRADFKKVVERERAMSDSLGGMTAGARRNRSVRVTQQLSLF